MLDAILKAKNSSFHKSMTFCRSIYVKKVMKLLAFILEQPSASLFQRERVNTIRHVLSSHSKIDKTNILMTNGSIMKVESIAAFCNTFDLH